MAENLKITSQGHGLPIVFIHGWGLNSAVWQPCLEHFKDNFEVITVDLPGYATNYCYELTEYSVDMIADVIQQTIAKPAVYIGWSLGGLVASKIALEHSEQVLGLVTVASSPQFVEREHSGISGNIWPGIKANVLSLFHRQLSENTTKTISNFLKIQAMGSPNIRHDIKLIRELVIQYQQPNKQILDDSLMLLETVDLSERLGEISQPFLRLYGQLDSLVPKQVVPLINTLAPSSDSYIFEKASHAPFISHQSEFLSVLMAWLKKC